MMLAKFSLEGDEIQAFKTNLCNAKIDASRKNKGKEEEQQKI